METMEKARKLRHSNKKNVESHYVAANPLKKTNTNHFDSHVLNNTSTVPISSRTRNNNTYESHVLNKTSTIPIHDRTRNTKTYQSRVFDRDSQMSRHSNDLDRKSL